MSLWSAEQLALGTGGPDDPQPTSTTSWPPLLSTAAARLLPRLLGHSCWQRRGRRRPAARAAASQRAFCMI